MPAGVGRAWPWTCAVDTCLQQLTTLRARRITGLDRNELGALLVAAGLGSATEHALISLLALNGLRVSEGHRSRHRDHANRAAIARRRRPVKRGR